MSAPKNAQMWQSTPTHMSLFSVACLKVAKETGGAECEQKQCLVGKGFYLLLLIIHFRMKILLS